MTGVFRCLDGDFPIGDVASIENLPPQSNQAERYRVKRQSGASTSLFTWEYRELMERPVQLLPADQGTELLRPYVDEEPFVDALPVLAWALCFDGEMRPVLPSGVHGRHEAHPFNDFLQLPDGRIFEFGREAEPDALQNKAEVIEIERVRRALARDERSGGASGEGEADA